MSVKISINAGIVFCLLGLFCSGFNAGQLIDRNEYGWSAFFALIAVTQAIAVFCLMPYSKVPPHA